jgi:hypothetical protein
MNRAAVLAVPAALAAVFFAACGTTEIDNKKAEDLIGKGLKSRGVQQATVKCPSGVEAKKGKTYTCQITLANGKKGTATTTLTDDKGHISGFQLSGS